MCTLLHPSHTFCLMEYIHDYISIIHCCPIKYVHYYICPTHFAATKHVICYISIAHFAPVKHVRYYNCIPHIAQLSMYNTKSQLLLLSDEACTLLHRNYTFCLIKHVHYYISMTGCQIIYAHYHISTANVAKK